MVIDRPIPLLAAVLAAASIAAGCGDGGETTVTETTGTETTATDSTTTEGTDTTATTSTTEDVPVTPERAALIEQADAICSAGDAEIEAAQAGVGETPDERQAFVIDTLVPGIQSQLDQLAELQPAEADAEEFRGIITDAQAAVDALAADPSLVTTEGVESPFAEVNARAQAFGLVACGS